MRKTLHFTDFELFKLLDMCDFIINCISCDLDIAKNERNYDNVIKYCDSIRDYSTIYKKIDYALDIRIAKK